MVFGGGSSGLVERFFLGSERAVAPFFPCLVGRQVFYVHSFAVAIFIAPFFSFAIGEQVLFRLSMSLKPKILPSIKGRLGQFKVVLRPLGYRSGGFHSRFAPMDVPDD